MSYADIPCFCLMPIFPVPVLCRYPLFLSYADISCSCLTPIFPVPVLYRYLMFCPVFRRSLALYNYVPFSPPPVFGSIQPLEHTAFGEYSLWSTQPLDRNLWSIQPLVHTAFGYSLWNTQPLEHTAGTETSLRTCSARVVTD